MSRPLTGMLSAIVALIAAGGAAILIVPRTVSDAANATVATAPVPPMQIGMNLGAMNYWSQEFAFADLVKASALMVVEADGWKPAEGRVSLDANGFPQDVAKGMRLMVVLKSGGGDRVPAGRYDCRMSPGWQVRGGGAAKTSGDGERFTLAIDQAPGAGRATLELTPRGERATLTALSCRNRAAAAGQDFNPSFLADTRPFAVLRFMDWMKTNNQPPLEWPTRTTPGAFTQAGPRGVAIEHMVALANAQRADPWFCLPLEAPDDYYRAFATYVRDHLDGDRRAYVEVSNEVWNTMFAQSKRATARGLELYPGETPIVANDYYYADRVRAVMTIWRDVFRARPSRIVRVLATQAGSTRRPTAALSHENTAKFVDALAIAPYFGPDRGEPPKGVDATDYLLSHGSAFVDKAIVRGQKSRAVAASFGLPLIAYEGGPDYVSFRPSLKAAFAKAEHDPRMYGIYTEFLGRWQREIGGLYVAYDFVNQRFGHQLYTGQPLADAPKMRALVDFMRREKLNDGRAETSD